METKVNEAAERKMCGYNCAGVEIKNEFDERE